MGTISFPEFVGLLPRGDDLRKTTKKLPVGVSWVETPNPCFVDPDLRVEQALETGRTSVILLAAPGAVGKSTVASELAARAHAFLWDLSKFQVGSQTFAGTIFSVYDFNSPGVQKRLKEGKFLFVLDALDEAQVRAGGQNFNAFITDLADTLREPREKPCVVLLARRDTADWIYLLFDDAGVPLARYEIEYFDKSRAVSFIEKRLDERRRREGSQPLHRQQVGPFSEALSQLFKLIYTLFDVSEQKAWDDSRVRDFLGYAPVLEALTDYVDVKNYMVLMQQVREDAGAARDPWLFLTDIVKRLSAREQGKVGEAVRVQLESAGKEVGWSEWQGLYAPAEQYGRVLGRVLGVPVDFPGGTMPVALARRYEEALETILPQHPFLSGKQFANVVFKEFVYAWGVARGGGPGLRDAMSHRETPFLPSQLFSRFILNLGDDGAVLLDGQDFGIVYESFLSRAQQVGLTLLQAGDGMQASIVLDGEEEAELEVLDTGPGVHFWRRLGNADVEVRGSLRLGLPGQRFLLGPRTDLECRQLAVGCEDLEVDVSGNVRIRAESYFAGSGQLSIRVRNETQGKLTVSWPGLGHPWVLYRGSESKGALELAETDRGDTLRKFVLIFRRQRTRLERTLLNARWSQGQLNERADLVDLALRKGVLRKISIPGRDLLEFSSDYDSLRTLVDDKVSLAPNARQFVTEYLGKEQAERLLGKTGA